jgi:hypothetical protein
MALVGVGWLSVGAHLFHPLFHQQKPILPRTSAHAAPCFSSFGDAHEEVCGEEADCPFCHFLQNVPADSPPSPLFAFEFVGTGRLMQPSAECAGNLVHLIKAARDPPISPLI